MQGKELVDEYQRLQEIKIKTEEKIEEIKAKLIEQVKDKGMETFYGTKKDIIIKTVPKIVYPEDKMKLIAIIKEKGLYEKLSMPNYSRISSLIKNKKIDQEIIDLVKVEESHRVTLKEP
ncbi:MAG: hypothetical protein ACI83O_000017 [Patescibacteria group bacterium]|jgi:hypothetical protein